MATPYAPMPSRFERPGLVTTLAVLDLVAGVLYAALGVTTMVVGRESVPQILGGALLMLLGLANLAAGAGLFLLASWGRWLQIALSAVGLLSVCGTLLNAAILYYLTRPGISVIFSGRHPQELAPQEWQEVQEGAGNMGLVFIAVAAVSVLVVPFVVGIVAAIAIPSLLRARVSANESATIGCLRTVVSAEMAYASANGGYYDRLECLAQPSSCIPGYAATGPRFLETCHEAQKSGYRFFFHPGPTPPDLDPATHSPTSLASFAHVATPVTPNTTGVRSFCADSSGTVCSTSGEAPVPQDGACPMSCKELR